MKWYKLFYSLLLGTVLLFIPNSNILSQSFNDQIKIKEITSNVNIYNDSFVKVVGIVTNIQNQVKTREFIALTKFTISDNSGSVNVIANVFNLQDNDSISVIGKFFKERKFGKYIAGENEIDATFGEIEVLTSGYKQQQEEDKKQQQIIDEKIKNGTADVDEMAVPSYTVDTPSTKMVTYATILGAIFTILTAIPLLTRRRRFNIDLKIILVHPPKIVQNNFEDEKQISIEIILHNLKLLPPEISSFISFQIGETSLIPIVTSKDVSELQYPLRIEKSLPLTLHFNYDTSINHFAKSETFRIKFKDEFCTKTFTKEFHYNFIIPSENETE